MLYTSFGRGQWRPNKFGGSENLESTEFLRRLNAVVTAKTGAYLIAEDSSILPGVTASVDDGGLGFEFKWNMGWMNDTLKYIGEDPIPPLAARQAHAHGGLCLHGELRARAEP